MLSKAKYSFLFLLIFNLISLYQHRNILTLDIQGIHTWRQSQTMWNIRNFVRHDNNIMNPRISYFNGGKDNLLRYEFPLMQWSIAQLQRTFGEDILIVRLSMFFIGLIGLWAFAYLIKTIFDSCLLGAIAATLLQYSPLFYYYTINPLPDVMAFSMSMAYLAFIVRYRISGNNSDLIVASIALLLATLCKLPFLMLSVVSIHYFFMDFMKTKKIETIRPHVLTLLILLPALAWYIWVMPSWVGNPILTGQLEAFNLREYLDIITYHAEVMFPMIITSAPVWLIFLIGVWAFIKSYKRYSWVAPIIAITFLYLFLELKPIDKVHDYYMFPFLTWIYILIAFGIERILQFKFGLIFIFFICLISSIYTPYVCKENWSIAKTYHIDDLFLHYKELRDAVPSDKHCIILNDVSGHIFSYKIDKMGYVFNTSSLPISWVDDMVRNKNVRYMYSDCRAIDESAELQKYIRRIIMQKGTIKVIELQLPST